MPVYKVLGDRIKKIRLENNMTQQEFAEALGYTHKSMVNKIETGLTEMSFDKVIALILTFNVNAASHLAYVVSTNGWLLLIAAGAIASIIMYMKDEVETSVHEEQAIL